MATRMGVRELRDNLTKTLRRVQQGETIEVTNNGSPVVLLSPVPEDRLARLIAAGLVHPAERPLHPLPDPVPVTGPMTGSQAIEEDRAGR